MFLIGLLGFLISCLLTFPILWIGCCFLDSVCVSCDLNVLWEKKVIFGSIMCRKCEDSGFWGAITFDMKCFVG